MSSYVPHFVACSAGFGSWLFLHRHSVYGDQALMAFMSTCAMLYLQLRARDTVNALRLTAEITGSYFFVLAASTISYRLSSFHPLSKHPGPLLWRISTLPLALVSVGGHRHLILDRLHKKYGRIVRIGPNTLSINSYSSYNTIYGLAHPMMKDNSYTKPGRVEGVTLFFQQTAVEHAARRQIWAQAFTSSALENFFPVLERRTWQLTECIERRCNKAEVVDLMNCICHWSYDFMGEMVFGGSNELELMRDGDPQGLVTGGKKALVALDCFGNITWLLDILWYFPAVKAMHDLRNVAALMMRTRVNSTNVKIRDLASYLLDGHPRTGEKISLSDLELDAIIAIQAGSDNTGTATAFAIYFMLSNPPIYEELHAALCEAFPDPCGPLDKRKLASIPLLNAVLMETLRLSSPFFLPRVVPPEGAIIEGTWIPGGTVVALAAHTQQTSEENFSPYPLRFLPHRWLPDSLGPGSYTNKGALFSFSTGPDGCIAKTFAMQEMRLCLARLVLTFEMKLPDGFDVEGFYRGYRNMRTTILDHPLMVGVVRRKGRNIPESTY